METRFWNCLKITVAVLLQLQTYLWSRLVGGELKIVLSQGFQRFRGYLGATQKRSITFYELLWNFLWTFNFYICGLCKLTLKGEQSLCFPSSKQIGMALALKSVVQIYTIHLLHISFNFQECLLRYSIMTNILILHCLLTFKKSFVSDECVHLSDQNIDDVSTEVQFCWKCS